MPSALRNRKRKAVSLAESFQVHDEQYVPPYENPDGSPKSRKAKQSGFVMRSKKKNRRDPFHVLNDDDVSLIIGYLQAADTETLRRVSKLWKASSEYHCGRILLLHHFPWAAATALQCGSREESNLQFRRYCTYNVVKGKALSPDVLSTYFPE